jgi:hypothetical protein
MASPLPLKTYVGKNPSFLQVLHGFLRIELGFYVLGFAFIKAARRICLSLSTLRLLR